MQAEQLDKLADAFPDCIVAAFADIATGITLLTRGSFDAPREALNELCAEAALTLGSVEAPALGNEPCPLAVKAVDHAVFVYVRSSEDPGDALLCMCKPDVDLVAFLPAAQACIDGGAD
jgi:hypothetical protein